MELFHSKLREAETAAVQKENDRKDWQKCKYSESKRTSRDGKEKQEENNLERFSYKEQLKEKYNKVCSEEPKNYRGSEQTETKKSRPSNKEYTAANWTYTTRKDPHQLNHFEKPFSSSVKAAFLKPSNDGEKGGRQQRTSSQLLTPRFMSCGFRKPVDDANVTPRWRKAQPKDEIGKATPNEKSSETNKAVTSKEEETKEKEEQISEAAVEEKELVDSKPSCSRYLGIFF